MVIVHSAGEACARSFTSRARRVTAFVPLVAALTAGTAAAQIVEATGSRALGMGGAFVAVANDASATWWNPSGLGDGPFFTMSLARAVTESGDGTPSQRHRVASFAVAFPAGGLGYYRLRLTEIRAPGSTGDGDGVREEEQGEVPVRSLAVSQYGVSLLQEPISDVLVGTTLKYLRGTHRSVIGMPGSAPDLLDAGEDLEGGGTDHEFDLDVGVLAARGPIKGGAVVRNLRAPEFEDPSGAVMRLPRQVRVGVAFDGARDGLLPLTVSLDADVRRYETAVGDRRVVAVGVEHWFFRERLGLRTGGRFNTVGAEDRAATGGVSVALRNAVYVDAHVVHGGTPEDQGWGLATRVSF